MKINGIIWLISETRELANEFIINELKKQGIKELVPSHGNILTNLYQNREMTMSEISKKIRKKCNTVTTLINKLVILGYIQKKTHSKDQRITLISLTEKGKTFEKNFHVISEKLINITYHNFKEQEKNDLMEKLLKIRSNFIAYKKNPACKNN